MNRVYTNKELQRLKKIKEAAIKVEAERKTKIRRDIEEKEIEKRLSQIKDDV